MESNVQAACDCGFGLVLASLRDIKIAGLMQTDAWLHCIKEFCLIEADDLAVRGVGSLSWRRSRIEIAEQQLGRSVITPNEIRRVRHFAVPASGFGGKVLDRHPM